MPFCCAEAGMVTGLLSSVLNESQTMPRHETIRMITSFFIVRKVKIEEAKLIATSFNTTITVCEAECLISLRGTWNSLLLINTANKNEREC